MVVIAVRLLSMLAFSYIGYGIAYLINNNFHAFKRLDQQTLAAMLGVLLGLLVGYIIGGVLGRRSADALAGLESSVRRVSGADLFFGVSGAILGLLAAVLVSIPLFKFGYAGYIVSLILLFVFGVVGMRTGIVKRSDLAALFKLGPGFGSGADRAGAARILDTSVIIDGRIVDVAKSGFLTGTMIVPRFVLNELQGVADSADTLKRNRGRRGLDVLNALQRLENVRIEITDQDFPEVIAVDGKLVSLSKLTGMPIITNDFNLNRVAEIQGIPVLNINELTSALKPVVLPGEELSVKIIREGKEPGQGVGYLDDGTMVVVEHAKELVGEETTAIVTSVLQTPAGKMIFTELKEEHRED